MTMPRIPLRKCVLTSMHVPLCDGPVHRGRLEPLCMVWAASFMDSHGRRPCLRSQEPRSQGGALQSEWALQAGLPYLLLSRFPSLPGAHFPEPVVFAAADCEELIKLPKVKCLRNDERQGGCVRLVGPGDVNGGRGGLELCVCECFGGVPCVGRMPSGSSGGLPASTWPFVPSQVWSGPGSEALILPRAPL